MSESVAHEQIRAFVERIERLEEERASIAKDIGEVYAEAKGNGFDRKALKIVVTRRRQDHNERMELEALVELYEAALIGRSADDYEEFGTVVATRAPARATREDEPEHDADGVIIEPDAAMRPQTGAVETLVANPEAADLATVTVAETALVPRVATASEPIADISKPNPICRDPEDCGVYASWHLTCEACKRAAAHRVAA